ncbi:MAG: alpha/beta fold hydrolase [Variibacter sp.]
MTDSARSSIPSALIAPSQPRRSHWVLLRGLAREADHWGGFPQIFSEALRSVGHTATVEAVDLPGTGALLNVAAPTNIDATADAARQAWLARAKASAAPLAAEGPRYLMAMSLGGMAANAWVTRWPRDFAGCVLINTSMRGYSPPHRRLRPSAYGALATILMTRDTLTRERAIVSLISNRPEILEATAREWTAITERRPISRATTLRQLYAAATYRARTPAIPALLLASRADRLVHPACSQDIAAQWRSELRHHPDAGHDLALDDPEWVAAQVCAWLAAQERTTAV